jgi:hypothetical protein
MINELLDEMHVSATADPIEGLRRLFNAMQKSRILAGQSPARRASFLKTHGSAYGTFRMRAHLPSELRVGIFTHESFPAWVRFSSDTLPGLPDKHATCGVGIKLFNVPGRKLLEPEALTQDFVLQNIDVFFVDDAQEMYNFTYAGTVRRDYDAYLKNNPKTKAILDRMSHPVESLARISYWSCVPSKLGTTHYVKYKLIPQTDASRITPPAASTTPNGLAIDLKNRLLNDEVRFTFCVQLRTHSTEMPIDQATIPWDEHASPPTPVADLILPRQDVDALGQAEYTENISYNAWHSLSEHEPVGSLQEARKVVYEASAALRREANGIPVVEPRTLPRFGIAASNH